MSAEDVRGLTDALYADGDLGPGYMYRDDCEHLATRFLVSGWLTEYVATKQAEAVEAVAKEWQFGGWTILTSPPPAGSIKALALGQRVSDWLSARAHRSATPEAGA